MKLQSLATATLFAAITALSLGAQAADADRTQTAGEVKTDQAATPPARHSHVQEKTGSPQHWPSGKTISASAIPASIANATTAADHLRIADYFAKEAAGFDAQIPLHEAMARSYAGRPKGDLPAMIAHCQELEAQFFNAAKEARALEQAHRQLASSASK